MKISVMLQFSLEVIVRRFWGTMRKYICDGTVFLIRNIKTEKQINMLEVWFSQRIYN